jgi:DNA-binding MarR family transcriptional regulator
MTSLDETTLTRNLRPLLDAGWAAIEPGEDRREKLVRLTAAGAAKLTRARPAWERAQARMRSRLPKADWSSLLAVLPELARLAGEA